MSTEYLVVELNHQPIELCKLLKIANLVSGGGEAKIVISEGYVLLNGEVEFQKRKKVYHEDVIEFNGDVLQVIVNNDLHEKIADNNPLDKLTDTKTSDKGPTKKKKNQSGSLPDHAQAVSPSSSSTSSRKRKPISF